MNASPRPSMNGMNPNSSFITVAANNIKNIANNAINHVNNGITDITEPINESIQNAFENNVSPIISVPVILMLGAFIIIFIIVVMFRDQITMALDLAWRKVKHFFKPEKEVAKPPPPTFAPEMQQMQLSNIEKILPGKKEVFNIAQDKYTYSDAEPLCKSFGAELATYDQVKHAWKKGADWCNYGWIKGQSAVYPTQQSTYDKAQAGPEEQRTACGVPGINGGYFDNPELRFGVNCYGTKPGQNEADTRYNSANKGLAPGALEYDKKVQNFKKERDHIPVNSFKEGSWSQ